MELSQLSGETLNQVANSKDKAGVKRAKELIERGAPEAMEALEKVVVESSCFIKSGTNFT